MHDLTNGQYWFDDNSINQGDTIVDIGTLTEAPEVPVPTFTKFKFTNAPSVGTTWASIARRGTTR
jgi:hypothetical protein